MLSGASKGVGFPLLGLKADGAIMPPVPDNKLAGALPEEGVGI